MSQIFRVERTKNYTVMSNHHYRQAWEYLQTMDRQKYKFYTKAVVAVLNDYYAREYRNEENPCHL